MNVIFFSISIRQVASSSRREKNILSKCYSRCWIIVGILEFGCSQVFLWDLAFSKAP